MLPQTSAEPSFQHGMLTGKFQGVIRPTTPSGSRSVSPMIRSHSVGAVMPWIPPPWLPIQFQKPIARGSSPRDSASVLPCSRVMSRAISSCALLEDPRGPEEGLATTDR